MCIFPAPRAHCSANGSCSVPDKSVNLSGPFPVHTSVVCCICCENHSRKEGAGFYCAQVCPRLLYGPKAPWLLFYHLQVTISNSLWKSWWQKSLVFTVFHPSNFVLSLLCVIIYCPQECKEQAGYTERLNASTTGILWPPPHTTSKPMLCLEVFFIISLQGSSNTRS